MSFLKKDYREIITKAVIGRGRKFTQDVHSVTPTHRPSSILGCWVINHLYHAKKKSADSVEVNGSYEINIWYSYNDNTKTEVVTERVTYRDIIPLSVKDENCLDDDFDVIVKVLQQPNCLESKIDKKGSKITVEVEREFVVQIIGETRLKVKVDPTWEATSPDEDDDDWDHKVTDEELEDVKPDFFGKKD
ncbi:outer spore coat protein CotE [Oceanobacillus sp. CAU 1775]